VDYNAEAKRINAERLTVWEENKRLLDDTKGQFNEEQKVEWDRRDGRINELAEQRDTMLDAAKREVEAGQLREAEHQVFGVQHVERKERSEAAEFRAWVTGAEKRSEDDIDHRPNAWKVDIRTAMRERDLLRQGASPEEIRTLLWDTGSVASAVPTTLSRTIYEAMSASIAAFRMPTTKITTDSGEPLQFPRASDGAATQVIAQGTAIGGTDPGFSRMQLDAYKYGQLVQLASEVIQDSGVDVVGYVGGNIGKMVGRLIDSHLIAGTGAGQPQGMMTAGTGLSGTVATGGSLINPTYENLVDLVYSLSDEYRSGGSAAWLMRDATAGVLRKLRDGAGGTVGAVLWDPSLTAGIQNGEPDRLLGFPTYADPNVASLASAAQVLGFGDWSAYYVRLVSGLVIERSDEYAFNTDLVTFRGKQRVDGDFIDLTATNRLRRAV